MKLGKISEKLKFSARAKFTGPCALNRDHLDRPTRVKKWMPRRFGWNLGKSVKKRK